MTQDENDPQTEADRQAQRSIVTTLHKRFPELAIIGEEKLADPYDDSLTTQADSDEVLQCSCPLELQGVALSDVVVWVDPLDGTTEFTRGFLDHVTTLIGITVKGVPVAGVIHQPFFNMAAGSDEVGRTTWGMIGVGVFGCTPVGSSGFCVPASPNNIRLTTTLSHSSSKMEHVIQKLNPETVIRVGGAGNKVLMVIEGKADAYVYATSGTKKWDTCAGEALLKARGGCMSDSRGSSIPYHPEGELANVHGLVASSCPAVHDMVLSVLKDID